MFKLILVMAIAVVMATCAPAPVPKPAPGPLPPLLTAYPVVYAAPYVKVYPYHSAAVPLAYYNYNSYKWLHPGSVYVY